MMTNQYRQYAELKSVENYFQVSFDGVDYLPTDSASAVGTLLFGLRPMSIEFRWNQGFKQFLHHMQTAVWSLHLYAHYDSVGVGFRENVEVEILDMIAAATALAPTLETALTAHNLIIEKLGPSCEHLRMKQV